MKNTVKFIVRGGQEAGCEMQENKEDVTIEVPAEAYAPIWLCVLGQPENNDGARERPKR